MAYSGTLSAAPLWYVLREHGVAIELAPFGLMQGGQYIAPPTGTLVGSSQFVRRWLDRNGFPNPHFEAFQLFSTTTAGSITTAVAASATGLAAFKQLQVQLDVTSTVGLTATLDVLIDSRIDGTNWSNIGRFSLLTTASRSVAIWNKLQATASEVTGLNADAGNGTIRNVAPGDDIRARYTISGATSQFTFTLYVNGIG